MPRKVKLFIAMSLDGYIATKEDDISFLDTVAAEGEDYGYGAFVKEIDTYIIGRKTYDKVVSLLGKLPQAEEYTCYIVSRSQSGHKDGVNFINEAIPEFVQSLKAKEGKDIYCDGGGEVIRLLMQHRLVDEITISIVPVVLGDGKRLFPGGIPYQSLKFIESKSFDSGLVQVKYELR